MLAQIAEFREELRQYQERQNQKFEKMREEQYQKRIQEEFKRAQLEAELQRMQEEAKRAQEVRELQEKLRIEETTRVQSEHRFRGNEF